MRRHRPPTPTSPEPRIGGWRPPRSTTARTPHPRRRAETTSWPEPPRPGCARTRRHTVVDRALRQEAEQLYEQRLEELRQEAEREKETEREQGIRDTIREIQRQRAEERRAEARMEARHRADLLARERHELESRIE